jgi:hypothetical protein
MVPLCNNESIVTDKRKLLFLAQPNRIGQGIEFDYLCVHGVLQEWVTKQS